MRLLNKYEEVLRILFHLKYKKKKKKKAERNTLHRLKSQ